MRKIHGGLGVLLLIGAAWLGGTAAPALAQQPPPRSGSPTPGSESAQLAALTATNAATAQILVEATTQLTAAQDAQNKAKLALRQAEREIPAPNSTDQARRTREEHIQTLDRAAHAATELVTQRTTAQLRAGEQVRAAATSLQTFVDQTHSPDVTQTSAYKDAIRWLNDPRNAPDRATPRATQPLGGSGTPVFGGQRYVPGPSAWERYLIEQRSAAERLAAQQKLLAAAQLAAEQKVQAAKRLAAWEAENLVLLTRLQSRSADPERRLRDCLARIDGHNRNLPNRANYASVESYNSAVRPYNAQAESLNREKDGILAELRSILAERRALDERLRNPPQ